MIVEIKDGEYIFDDEMKQYLIEFAADVWSEAAKTSYEKCGWRNVDNSEAMERTRGEFEKYINSD